MSFSNVAAELNRLRRASARPPERAGGRAAWPDKPLIRATPDSESSSRNDATHVLKYDGFTIHYADRPSLDTQLKDILGQRIYDFTPRRPDPFIIDGGASIGVATLAWKRAIPAARVLCFEPDQDALALLRRNLAANGHADVTIVEAGLSDHDGTATFQSDGADGGRMSPDPAARPTSGNVAITTTRLSRYIDGPVDLLKLNVEGQELPVLREMEAASKLQHVERIILEYHGWPGSPQGLGQILDMLARQGFRYLVHDFDRATNPATKPPFRLRPAPWFCLVYAERTHAPARDASVQFGDLRRVAPISRVFGLDRGTPIDRYYIEQFLASQAGDIRGTVLEVADDAYTRRFGGERVTQRETLFAPPGHRRATYIADLGAPRALPADAFDCMILTQTLHCIYDIQTAVKNCLRALRPGGVLLATLPGISQISRYDMDRWGDFWRLTTASARRLIGDAFGPTRVQVAAHGNALTATAFLHGLCTEELDPFELDHVDPDYELLITVRAEKGA
ncbi:2-O-methyltransferase NoeI [Phycisphaerae bacterium RAS2]|nr:2-O-methyltransferase NoeI [Phycisphaerae bacterium RAS2]